MKDYLPLFNTNADYEAYKNNPKKVLLPNVSYVQEDGVCYFNSIPTIYATYNATSENMLAINSANYIKSLKIDGTYITTNGRLTKPYYFETEGVHEMEIEFTDYTIINYMFSNTCITNFSAQHITSIGDFAFQMCKNLSSVDLGNSVTSIGTGAFSGCSNLTSVIIPDNIINFSSNPFSGCPDLAEFNGQPVLIANNKLIAFAPASDVTTYTIPDGVTSIGEEAFDGCYDLTSITIPNSVTSIGSDAFQHCYGLTSITIPEGVTSIGYCAFYQCKNLTSVYCQPMTPPTGNFSMFSGNASGRKIYVPMASVDAYKSAEYWSSYADVIEGYNF